MKKLLLSAAGAALLATSAFATGPGTPTWIERDPTPPPQVSTNWGGFAVVGMLGYGETEMSRLVPETPGELLGYERECQSSNHEKYTWAGKCEVTMEDWLNSPELLALNNGVPLGGHPSGENANFRAVTDFRYHGKSAPDFTSRYPGVWVSEQTGALTYFSANDDRETTAWGKHATNALIGEVWSDTVPESTETSTTAEGRIGVALEYRWDLGTTVVGAGAEMFKGLDSDNTTTNLVGQAGVELGSNALLFAKGGWSQLSMDNEFASGEFDGAIGGIGIDYRVADGMFVRAQITSATYDVNGVDTPSNNIDIGVGFTF